jgi:membrane protease YdiL (CAAX protease family)
MEDVIAVPEDEAQAPTRAPRKGHPLLAWIAIIGLVAGLFFLQTFRSEKRAVSENGQADQVMLQLQARNIVGLAQFANKSDFEVQVLTLNTGPIPRRLRAIVLIGELSGPSKAKELLKDLDSQLHKQGIDPSAKDKSLEEILKSLYADYAQGRYDAPSLQTSDREALHRELGWFGDLALAPEQGPDEEARARVLLPAMLTSVAILGLVVLGLMAAVAGLFGLIFLIIYFYSGYVRGGLQCGLTYGALYAETFAIWLVVFPLLSLAASLVPANKSQLLMQGLGMLLSLSVLGWPVLRGVPWRQVRQDIGLTFGRWPLLEPLFGAGGYAMTLPLLGIGVIIVLGILLAQGSRLGAHPENSFAPIDQPSHPIVGVFASGNWWAWLQVAVLATIIAPIVEETMFRGVLYRHLREMSCRLGFTLSVLTSGFVVSFIFAVIHPQGLIAVPALMALAFGFAIIREWRGALVPCMVAHGINNGILTLVLILAAS